jgi:hypothetical protein
MITAWKSERTTGVDVGAIWKGVPFGGLLLDMTTWIDLSKRGSKEDRGGS